MKFLTGLYKFMYGRYGIDELYHFLFFLYLFIVVADLFIKNNILFCIELLLLIIIFYRCFSKNINQRRKENESFLKLKNKLAKPFKNIKRNYKDRNNYVYKKCRNCHTTLRLPLPSKRGIKYAKCPNCKRRVKIISLRKLKIEVIRKDEAKC